MWNTRHILGLRCLWCLFCLCGLSVLPSTVYAQARVEPSSGFPELARARALLEQGAALEGTLILRRLATESSAQAPGSAGLRDLARYELGRQKLAQEDAAGALAWFDAIERPLADQNAGLDLLFGRARCLSELGRSEEVVPFVARELSTLRRAFPGATPEPQIAYRVLELALRAGQIDWVSRTLARSADEVLTELLSSASAAELSALAALPGLPSEIAEPLMAWLGGAERLQVLIERALLEVDAAGGAGSALRSPTMETLTRAAPGLFTLAAGPVLVPLPESGDKAIYGAAVRRVLELVNAGRAEPVPWRFIDSASSSLEEQLSDEIRGAGASVILGPLGPTSLPVVLRVAARHAIPVIPLFPDTRDRAPGFPLLALVFDEQEVVKAALMSFEPQGAADSDPGDPGAPGSARTSANGARVAIVQSQPFAERGLGEVASEEFTALGAEVLYEWTLPEGEEEQAAAVERWSASLDLASGELPFDVVYLATRGAEGLRVLSLFQYRGLRLAGHGECAAAGSGSESGSDAGARKGSPRSRAASGACVRVIGHRSLLSPDFSDPVSYLSDGARIPDPCGARPGAVEEMTRALGRPPFPIESITWHLATVLAEARDLVRTRDPRARVLDLSRELFGDRRWSGPCGVLEARGGRGLWEITIQTVQARGEAPVKTPDQPAPPPPR